MNTIQHIEGGLYDKAVWLGKPTGLSKTKKTTHKKVVYSSNDYSDSVTIFPSLFDTKTAKYRTFEDVVNRIKNGNSKDMVERIRKGDKKLKTSLPAICFSGIFSQRCDAGLIKPSGLVCLDFDDVPEVEKFKKALSMCKYVRSAFISPSGTGVKVIVKINGDHKDRCNDLADYFRSEFLDLQTDICRVCFESYDKKIYYNPKSEEFNGRR